MLLWGLVNRTCNTNPMGCDAHWIQWFVHASQVLVKSTYQSFRLSCTLLPVSPRVDEAVAAAHPLNRIIIFFLNAIVQWVCKKGKYKGRQTFSHSKNVVAFVSAHGSTLSHKMLCESFLTGPLWLRYC